jgi:hypothetical protein
MIPSSTDISEISSEKTSRIWDGLGPLQRVPEHITDSRKHLPTSSARRIGSEAPNPRLFCHIENLRLVGAVGEQFNFEVFQHNTHRESRLSLCAPYSGNHDITIYGSPPFFKRRVVIAEFANRTSLSAIFRASVNIVDPLHQNYAEGEDTYRANKRVFWG